MDAVDIAELCPELDGSSLLRREKRYLAVSRIRDLCIAIPALLLLLPLMCLISIVIVLDSPGAGPIFAQTRIGLNGRPFRMYKFRSMVPGAEAGLDALLSRNEMDGPVFKMREDPRITRFGRLLRRSFLDELPQLWNVIRGDMSLVGPRPALPREVAQYTARQRLRLQVTPGITCFWQARPDRHTLPFEQWVSMDLRYIRQRSLVTDLKILWDTVGVVLAGKGL